MKSISIKLDNLVLDLLNKESKDKKTTRMELIRSAILNYLINKDDIADLKYIEEHRNDELLSFDEVFS